MTNTHPVAHALNASSAQDEASPLICELTREQAEERRWQLEWDRRNLED